MTLKEFSKYYKYFTEEEFESPDSSGSGLKMIPMFMNMLYEARQKAGIPFEITSGFATKAHNKERGGVEDSSHLLGIAADIRVNNSTDRFKILSSLIEAGFTRIGIGSNFIHCDCDKEKAQGVVWGYYENHS